MIYNMKKILLSMVALLSSALTFAQVTAGSINAEVNPNVSAHAAVKKAAPAKAELASNQRLMGYYTSDEVAANGLGLPTAGKNDDLKVAVDLDWEVLSPFVGMKVVGIRYAVKVKDMVNYVLLGEFGADDSFGDIKVSEPVTSSVEGWNTQMFSTPYTIKDRTDLYFGYSYKQTATKSGSYYTTDAYVMSLVDTGMPEGVLFAYLNGPSGLNWYELNGTTGNLSVQLIIEGDYKGQHLVPLHLGDFQTAVNHEKTVTALFENVGAQPVSNFSYTYTQNGVTSEEKTQTLDAPEAGTIVTLPFTISGASATGKYPVDFTVTKVNGEPNIAVITSTLATNEVKAKYFKPTAVMEEFTGTGCGYCPRGMVGMEKLAEKFGEQFIGIAYHQYNPADPMYNRNYANLGLSSAPNCKLNRATAGIDPFYGSGSSIADDVAPLLTGIPDAAVTSIDAQWSTEAQDSVFVQATFEAQDAKTYQTAYVLTADDVKGEGTDWAQANYFSKSYGTSYSQLPDDLKFLWNESAAYYPSFPDVLIGSSYVRTTNKADNVDVPAEGSAHGQYNIGLPLATNKVMAGVDKTKLNVIVLIIDPTTRYIVNAAKTNDIKAWTSGINTVNGSNGDLKEVARYTVGGQRIAAPQKGINIIKMSDGTTRKVFVNE